MSTIEDDILDAEVEAFRYLKHRKRLVAEFARIIHSQSPDEAALAIAGFLWDDPDHFSDVLFSERR